MFRAVWAKFTAEFWRGFEQARDEARAKAQPAPLDASPFDGMNVDEVKIVLAAALRGSYDEGVAAEKARIEAILGCEGAKVFAEIAIDLLRGPATGAQAAAVLSRAEADAATRAGAIKSNILDRASSQVTLH
jgi:hypothetical protein